MFVDPFGKVIVVLGNFSVHKSALVEAKLSLFERGGRLERFFLPSYAPELNGMEKIWRQMRRRVTHNRRFCNLDELEAAVNCFFTELGNDPKAIKSLTGLPDRM